MNFPEKWKQIVSDMNSKGIPLPLIRDPKTGSGSVSLTLVFISFNLVIVGLMGKYSKMLEGVDVGQAISLFSICAALYWSRKAVPGKEGVTIENPGDSTDKDIK